jgi:hypothetical protein
MRSAALVTAVALATVGITAPRAAADSCRQDGVANLCASTSPGQNAVNIDYSVTQLDGPGSYLVYYVNAGTGAMSTPRELRPIKYLGTASGTFSAAPNACYTVNLTSTAGTYLVLNTVCG